MSPHCLKTSILVLIVFSGACNCADEVDYVYRFRVVNWCVIGKSEEALFEWPLVQFKPFLLKTSKFQQLSDFKRNQEDVIYHDDGDETALTPKPILGTKSSHTLKFRGITCDAVPNIGQVPGGIWHHRLHIELTLAVDDANFEGAEGVLIQGNHAPYGLGFPFGQFDISDEFQCECNYSYAEIVPCLSRPDLEIIAPTVAAFHYQLRRYVPNRIALASTTNKKFPKVLKEVGIQKEFHFNYKWHSTPCSSATTVEFWVLIVHSFFRRRYEIKRFGPYDFSTPLPADGTAPNDLKHDLKSGAPPTPSRTVQNPPLIPSPIFSPCSTSGISPPSCNPVNETCAENYTVQCHGAKNVEQTKLAAIINTAGHIRFNGEFDSTCISRYSQKTPHKQCPEWTGKFKCNDKTYSDLQRLDKRKQKRADGKLDEFFKDTYCLPCKYEPTTQFSQPPEPSIPFFKRNSHGAVMILAFLFVMPVAILIGRFFKETFHGYEFKGWRLWLWMHFCISLFGLLLSYLAYNIPTFYILDTHMYLGYVALYSGLFALISGWGRHKWQFNLTLYLHSLSGYVSWFSAAAAMWFTTASFEARVTALSSLGFCFLAMLILTCQVWSGDSAIGMQPSRKHTPILQIRFENVYPPGHKTRLALFYIIVVLLLVVVFLSLVQ